MPSQAPADEGGEGLHRGTPLRTAQGIVQLAVAVRRLARAAAGAVPVGGRQAHLPGEVGAQEGRRRGAVGAERALVVLPLRGVS